MPAAPAADVGGSERKSNPRRQGSS
jgi:hypothetical protein